MVLPFPLPARARYGRPFSNVSPTLPPTGGRSLAKAVAPKEVYSFPILEPEEIVDVLREMGAAVTEEDINKPKAETFRALCELFVFEVLGISKDQLYEAHFEFVEALDGTEELHEASVPIVHFIRNMCVAANPTFSPHRTANNRRRRKSPPPPPPPPLCFIGTRCSLLRAATRGCPCGTS